MLMAHRKETLPVLVVVLSCQKIFLRREVWNIAPFVKKYDKQHDSLSKKVQILYKAKSSRRDVTRQLVLHEQK